MKKKICLLMVVIIASSLILNNARADQWSWNIKDFGYVTLKRHSPDTAVQVNIPDTYFPKEDVKKQIIDMLKASALIGTIGAAALSQALEAGMGLPIKAIGESAFSNHEDLEYVSIPGSVDSLGAYAFWGCCSLKSIEIPDSVTSIGEYCFGGCGEDIIIRASYGSAAWEYAINQGYPFEDSSGGVNQGQTGPLPDLLPDAITARSDSMTIIRATQGVICTYRTNDKILFDTGIINSGAADTEDSFNIKWYVGNSQLGYGLHRPVPANTDDRDGNSRFFWTPTSPGHYTVLFVVDCDDQIKESNEINNEAYITIAVSD